MVDVEVAQVGSKHAKRLRLRRPKPWKPFLGRCDRPTLGDPAQHRPVECLGDLLWILETAIEPLSDQRQADPEQ